MWFLLVIPIIFIILFCIFYLKEEKKLKAEKAEKDKIKVVKKSEYEKYIDKKTNGEWSKIKYYICLFEDKINLIPSKIFVLKVGINDLKGFFDKIMEMEEYYTADIQTKANLMQMELIKYLYKKDVDGLKEVNVMSSNPYQLTGVNSDCEEVLYRVFNGGVTKHTPSNVMADRVYMGGYDESYNYPLYIDEEVQKKITIYHRWGEVRQYEFENCFLSPNTLPDYLGMEYSEVQSIRAFRLKDLMEPDFKVKMVEVEADFPYMV